MATRYAALVETEQRTSNVEHEAAGRLAAMGGDNGWRRACDQSPKARTAQGGAVAVQSAPSLRDQLGDERSRIRMAGSLSRHLCPWPGEVHLHCEQRRR